MIRKVKYYKCCLVQFYPLSWRWNFFSSDKNPSFIIQITTLRLSSASLDELRAFNILHNVFALQAEVIIKTLRKYIRPTTNIMTEAAGSLDGMYYWAKVPHVRYLIASQIRFVLHKWPIDFLVAGVFFRARTSSISAHSCAGLSLVTKCLSSPS